jgi:hypothetical protein
VMRDAGRGIHVLNGLRTGFVNLGSESGRMVGFQVSLRGRRGGKGARDSVLAQIEMKVLAAPYDHPRQNATRHPLCRGHDRERTLSGPPATIEKGLCLGHLPGHFAILFRPLLSSNLHRHSFVLHPKIHLLTYS